MLFKEAIRKNCEGNHWFFRIGLTSGISFDIAGEYLQLGEDFLQFDRAAADVAVDEFGYNNGGVKIVIIPYSSIAFVSEHSS